MRWGSVSSDMLMYGGGVYSIVLLPLVVIRLSVSFISVWSSCLEFPDGVHWFAT